MVSKQLTDPIVKISPCTIQTIPTNRHFCRRCKRPFLLFWVYSHVIPWLMPG